MLSNMWTRLGSIAGWMSAWIVALAFCLSGAVAQEPVPHLALVVGNAAYADAQLPTAANDAGLVARALSQAGFAVTAAGDTDRARLDAVFETFAAQVKAAGPSTIVFVYLAGYGVQFSGDIYVVPIGAKVARDVDVPREAVSVSAFRRQLETLPVRARVLVYDLARDTPFALDGTRLAGGLALGRPEAGTLLAFNAAPGTIAAPDVAPYGFYARALSEMIGTPGLGLPTLFERVRLRVSMLTGGATLPWNSGTIADDVTLMQSGPALRTSNAESRPSNLSVPDQAYLAAIARDDLDGYLAFLKSYPAEPLAARMRTLVAVRREALLWTETLRVDSDRAYWTYMRRYPRGPHLPDARRRLLALHAPLDPPPRFDIVPYVSAGLPQAGEAALIDRPVVSLDDAAWPPMPGMGDTLPSPPSALYDALPPPPLVEDGILPIADPLANGRTESVAISQPNVPSGKPIVVTTSFLPSGGWVVASVAGGTTIGRETMTPGAHADRTIVQIGPDGAVVARTTIVHDMIGHDTIGNDTIGTTIIQTGPSGGILTKSVTRAENGGGRTTVLTTGGNQMIATVRIDARGVASVKRGPAALPPPGRPAVPLPVVIPADPPAPPPLTMPMSSLPEPAIPPQVAPGKAAESRTTASKAPETAQAAVPSDPATHLPVIAPLPPRRDVPTAKVEGVKKTAGSRKPSKHVR